MIDAAQPEQEAKILGWQKRLPASPVWTKLANVETEAGS